MDLRSILASSLVAAVVATGALFLLNDSPKTETFGGASPDVYGYFNVHGAFFQGGGTRTATPVAATYTVTADDLRDSNVLTFTASSTMPALTATLPASTTFPLSAEAGSYRTWVIENPFTAAATTTTIAAGTGIDLQIPETTGADVVLNINGYGFLTCFREASTDIVCRLDETVVGD